MSCLEIVITAIMALKPHWSEAKIETYAKPICIESKAKDLDPLLVVALIQHETEFNSKIIYNNKNGSKDFGLMQFNCPSYDRYYKIRMKFRRYWCHSSKRQYLKSIEGNIKAGTTELNTWRNIAIAKHNNEGFLYYNNNNFIKKYNILNIFKFKLNYNIVCRDCFSVATNPLIYNNLNVKWNLKKVLTEHWWIKHYNWGSKNYSLGVLYVYKVLLERRISNYPMIKNSWHRNFSRKGILRYCITEKDMCLSKFPKRLRK